MPRGSFARFLETVICAGNQSASGPPDKRDLQKIKSAKPGAPATAEQPAPIAVYAATPFNAADKLASQQKQPIGAPGTEEKTDFIYFQRQVCLGL